MDRIDRFRACLVVTGILVLMGLALGACTSNQPELGAEPVSSAVALPAATSGSANAQPVPISTDTQGMPAQPEEEDSVPKTPNLSIPDKAGVEGMVAQAKDHLAQRLGVDADQIEVIGAEPVVWSDGALGCPQPGMSYIQVLQDGVLIRLAAEGKAYNYHGGSGSPPFLCERSAEQPVSNGESASAPPTRQPSGPAPMATPLRPGKTVTRTKSASPTLPAPVGTWMAGIVEEATEDLAQRLSVEKDAIELVEAKGVLWPDGGLGCPQPGMAYIQVQRDGAFVRLRVGPRTYNYHAGYPAPVFLCEHPDSEVIP